jgi:hypothetical protein
MNLNTSAIVLLSLPSAVAVEFPRQEKARLALAQQKLSNKAPANLQPQKANNSICYFNP